MGQCVRWGCLLLSGRPSSLGPGRIWGVRYQPGAFSRKDVEASRASPLSCPRQVNTPATPHYQMEFRRQGSCLSYLATTVTPQIAQFANVPFDKYRIGHPFLSGVPEGSRRFAGSSLRFRITPRMCREHA